MIKSNGIAELTTPPAPAAKNSAIPPTAHIIGVANLILPFHMVARKLKTCIAEAGTAASGAGDGGAGADHSAATDGDNGRVVIVY